MKILILTRLFHPHIGGVEKQVMELSRVLIKKGHTIKIITERYDKRLRKHERIGSIEIYRIDYPKIRFLGLISIWNELFKHISLIKNSDLIHCHGVYEWYYPFRFIFFNKPNYVTFYGWEGKFPIPKKNIVLKKISNMLSDGSIADADFIAKYYKIQPDMIKYPSIVLPKKRKFSKKKKSILYVGRLDADTGLSKILKTLKFLKGWEIEFCGDGLLRNKCEKIGNVHGFTDPNKFYQKAQFCISAGATSIIEAMSHRCVIATTYDSPVKKDYLLMTPFKNWIIVEKKPEKLANKIKYYEQHFDKARQKIDPAHKWALNQSWEKQVEVYEKLWSKKQIKDR